MSTVFTASNGVTVAVAPDSTGGVFTVTTKGGPGEVPVLAELYYDELTALREFHQHENDVRLGRWRSKVLTDYVVYERGGGWLVLNEASGNTKHYSHRNHAEAGGTLLSQVAREFFAAHRIWPASEATA